jgi:hypothetical protein
MSKKIKESEMDQAVKVSNDEAEKVQTGKKRLVDASEYWNFETDETFIGYFCREKRDDSGKLIGYIFAGEDGDEFIISNCFSITKALEMVSFDHKALLEIIFRGKVTVKSTGKPFNKFEINLLN